MGKNCQEHKILLQKAIQNEIHPVRGSSNRDKIPLVSENSHGAVQRNYGEQENQYKCLRIQHWEKTMENKDKRNGKQQNNQASDREKKVFLDEQYVKTEENARELKKQEKKSPRQQLSEEVKKVIEEGDRYIEEIRRSNDAIPGVEISNKIYHMENVILRIFQRVEQHPELIQDLHKFMDYYLPTTVKLLNAYEELDKQRLEGENIKTAKREIENTLDTINVAFENLLDSFYNETAWVVSADISVLKTMLAQEGLTEEKNFQRKES